MVSAMAGVTNQLVDYVKSLSPLTTVDAWAEYDQVVSSGEQVTSGLLSLALNEMGIPAHSFAGGQIPAQDRQAARQGAHRRNRPEAAQGRAR